MVREVHRDGVIPLLKVLPAEDQRGIRPILEEPLQHRRTLGMNEACLKLLDHSIADEEGSGFAEKVLDFMRNKLQDFQEETGIIYNLEATPAKGSSYRLTKIDKQRFPNIIVANERLQRILEIESFLNIRKN
jgi:anaerobic ribonucleoside-triphosphate reductase